MGKKFGKDFWRCFAPPEKLPKFDENLRFFPPILEAIRTFVCPCKLFTESHILIAYAYVSSLKYFKGLIYNRLILIFDIYDQIIKIKNK